MERPLIQNFMPEGTTLATAHRKYMDAPELYAYMTALDAYADHLEDQNRKLEIAEKLKKYSDNFWKPGIGESNALPQIEYVRTDTDNQ